MQKAFLRLVAAATLTMWAMVLYLVIDLARPQPTLILPTLARLPTLIPSSTLTSLPSSTATLAATATFSLTPSVNAPLASATATLSERLLRITAIMPGVALPVVPTAYPLHMTLLPAPPAPVEPLPDATRLPPPYYGWTSFESDHPLVHYATGWERRLHALASRGQYHRTEDVYSTFAFAFEGEGLRIRYVAARNMGVFAVVVDGMVIDTVDAFAPELTFPATRVYTLATGRHTLELRSTGSKHPQSEGYTVALDAIQVWRGDPHTQILPPQPTLAPSPSPRPAQVELVSAPPTVEPTPTPAPPREVQAAVLIAYDENGNQAVDPAEGVAGISVRVVETNTNRVVASGFTDGRGYVAFTLIVETPVRIVVPYFGESWALQRGREGVFAFTLLLDPGNQPGLIP